MMLNLRIPQCVADKLDELTALCEENPMNLTVRQAAKFLGVDANSQYIAIGIVIFVAISLDIRKYVQKK